MIKHLFTYDENGNPKEHDSLTVTINGIEGNRKCHSWRQVLILPVSTLQSFRIEKKQLRENIVIDSPLEIHKLESGVVLGLGETEVRLTFHCEPCKKIKNIVSPRKIIHQRGYLGNVLKGGAIRIGDQVSVKQQRYEAIPYELADRVKWYINKSDEPVLVSKLVEDIGLSKSYCRAIPNIIRNRSDIDKRKILFLSGSKACSTKSNKQLSFEQA